MFTENEKTFVVTRLISPNHFYLYDSEQSDIPFVNKLELRIAEEVQFSSKTQDHEEIKKGDAVAYYWPEGKKYIRCEVDDHCVFMDKKQVWFLFSLDYGVSIYTSTRPHKLPECFKFVRTAVMGPVSLQMLPSDFSYNFLQQKFVPKFSSIWSMKAMKLFHQHTARAVVIKFVPSKTIGMHRGFVFGDLKLTTADDREYSLSDELMIEKAAQVCEDGEMFYKQFLCTNTILTQRWNDYLRRGGILKSQVKDCAPINCLRDLEFKRVARIDALHKFKVSTYPSIMKVNAWMESNRGIEPSNVDEEDCKATAEPVDFEPYDSISELSICFNRADIEEWK